MSGVTARTILEQAVRRELFGPPPGATPVGEPLDCSSGSVHFDTVEASRTQFHDASTGEEVLTQSDPLRRYGIGILHSAGIAGSKVAHETDVDTEENLVWLQGLSENEIGAEGPTIDVQGVVRDDEADSDDFDLTDANAFKPSAMAVSLKCRIVGDAALTIVVTGAYYDRVVAHIPGLSKPRDWWVRRPFEVRATVPAAVLVGGSGRLVQVRGTAINGTPRVSPTLQLFTRPVPRDSDPSTRLLTVAVVNRSSGTGPSNALFQTAFVAEAARGLVIEPYPEVDRPDNDDEEASIDLLYRNRRTFGIGHGCAADWAEPDPDSVAWVAVDPLPAFEVNSLTPDVYVADATGQRSPVTVSMAELAAESDAGRRQVDAVLDLYEQWIKDRDAEVDHLALRFRDSAARHIDRCRSALERMREGWALVSSNALAARAFQLANEAMLFQQVRSRLPVREVERGSDDVLRPVGPHPVAAVQPGQGNWRPFQIAFLLAVVPEIAEPNRETRRVVDLIFFPTGGGKTEAYLGASAFSLLCRRLRDPGDVGTDTLMRYTLRLLTAQQFLRAAALICVLEEIRSRHRDELGEGRFGIGVWLGGESTPNTWQQAVQALGRLRRDPQAPNPFLLLRCPWCGTRLGTKQRGTRQDVFGYDQVGNRVALRCILGSRRNGDVPGEGVWGEPRRARLQW